MAQVKPMTAAEAVAYIKAKIAEADGGTQKAFAASANVSPGYLNRTINGSIEPSKKLLDAVGLERRTIYVPKERGTK